MAICIGSRVAIVVPFGSNRGVVCGRGEVIAQSYSAIDGPVYVVREAQGPETSETEYAASWLRTAR